MTKEAKDYVATVAKNTEGYSGSDLKEVCRAAAWEPVRELTTGASQTAVGMNGNGSTKQSKQLKRTSSGFPPRGTKARPVNPNDFDLALQKVKKTGDSARQFHKKEFIRGREDRRAMAEEINKMNGNAVPQQVDLNQLMAAAMAAMSNVQNVDANEVQNEEDSDGPPEMFVDATNGLN